MIIVFALLIAAVVFLPYIKKAVGRATFLMKLKKRCALKRYRIKMNNLFSALLSNFSEGYHLTVDTGKTVYALRFWDETYKNSSVSFGSDMRVRSRRKIPDTFGNGNKRSHRISERELGKFPRLSPPNTEGRRVVCVLVMHPTDAVCLYQSGGVAREIRRGDRLYGMLVVSRAELLRAIGKGT